MYPLIDGEDLDMAPCKVYTHPHEADVTEIKVRCSDRFII